MKYVDEFHDPKACRTAARAIERVTTRPWTVMEICGGQTHAIVKHGLDELLPGEITLLHGPGCPVCVTPVEMIDKAIAIASRGEVVFCAFGDMMRVPGTGADLLGVRSKGGDVRLVYSPLDALKMALGNPRKQVVFFAVGFETTAPVCAMAAWRAREEGIGNFSLLVAHVLVPPAVEAILSAPGCAVDGFLAAGHVCSVMGYTEYEAIAAKYRKPIVVTGFEPLDILQGILTTVRQLEEGRAEVENQYARAVRREGSPAARKLMGDVFRVTDRKWRGIGAIPASGLALRDEFSSLDAETRFEVAEIATEESTECISGLVLQGKKKPADCPAFATRCTPERPLGATMVSSEGACAAYYRYRRS
ncbi:MAG TPA: hydrogenase formation protein HypD [Sumerlaeia bacterium]|nr:hydrogenase formation protein HypD [Sumerlaeia bacterium]